MAVVLGIGMFASLVPVDAAGLAPIGARGAPDLEFGQPRLERDWLLSKRGASARVDTALPFPCPGAFSALAPVLMRRIENDTPSSQARISGLRASGKERRLRRSGRQAPTGAPLCCGATSL
jgi:hypothetical protein